MFIPPPTEILRALGRSGAGQAAGRDRGSAIAVAPLRAFMPAALVGSIRPHLVSVRPRSPRLCLRGGAVDATVAIHRIAPGRAQING